MREKGFSFRGSNRGSRILLLWDSPLKQLPKRASGDNFLELTVRELENKLNNAIEKVSFKKTDLK